MGTKLTPEDRVKAQAHFQKVAEAKYPGAMIEVIVDDEKKPDGTLGARITALTEVEDKQP